MKIHSSFNLPSEFNKLGALAEVVISDRCQDFETHPDAIKILILTRIGLIEAGRCRADFYARDLEDAYLWLRLQFLQYRP